MRRTADRSKPTLHVTKQQVVSRGPHHRPAAAEAHLGVATQVEFESKTSKLFIIFQFQALSSRRFQHGFHRFDLHRPTSG